MSIRQQKFQMMATQVALKSSAVYRHGSLITRGSHIYATGFNNPRSSFLGKTDYCQHAEMAAATTFINSYVRRKGSKYCFPKHRSAKGTT